MIIKERPTDAFPRPGGSPLYVARPIAAAQHDVSIVTWVGDDALGGLFRRYTEEFQMGIDGIVAISDGATPTCFLIYQEDGSCGCCFDPGMLGRESLDSTQIDLIRGAQILGITVGPPDIGLRALELVSTDCAVAWVAKNDPLSFPEELRQQLGQRSRFVFCNSQEREWIDAAVDRDHRPNVTIIETRGAEQVKYERGAEVVYFEVPSLEFNDASGAGDTFAGGCLAAIADGATTPETIVQAGIAASAELLGARARQSRTK